MALDTTNPLSNSPFLVKAVSLNQDYSMFNNSEFKAAGTADDSNCLPQESAVTSQQVLPDIFQTYSFTSINSVPELDYKMLSATLQKTASGASEGLPASTAACMPVVVDNSTPLMSNDWSHVIKTTNDSLTIPVTSGGFSLPVTLHDKETTKLGGSGNVTNVYHTEGVTIPVTLHTDAAKKAAAGFRDDFSVPSTTSASASQPGAFSVKSELAPLVDGADTDLRVHLEQEYQNYTCDFDSLQQDFNMGPTAVGGDDDSKLFTPTSSVEGFPLQVVFSFSPC